MSVPPVPQDVPEARPGGRSLRGFLNALRDAVNGGGGGNTTATYVTQADESAVLPNSRQLAAGTGITLTDGGAGSTLTIAASGGGGSGTVTSIATTSPITGGPITTTGTIGVSDLVGDSGSGGTRGTVPAPAAGDAAAGKFLKADGTWATPITSVASADGSITVTNPTGPAVDLSVPATGPTTFEPTLTRSVAELRWNANGTAVSAMGFQGLSVSGSLTASAQTNTNPLTAMRCSFYASSALANSGAGVISTGARFFISSAAWYGGFTTFQAWGVSQSNSDSRLAVGITQAGSIIGTSSTNPSASAGAWIVFGMDSSDTGLQLMYRDGTSSATKVALGANFPRPLSSDAYYTWMWCAPNSGTVNVRLDRITSAATYTYTAALSSNLPPTGTPFDMVAGLGTGPTTAVSVRINLSRFYVSTIP